MASFPQYAKGYANARHDTITLFRTPHAVDAPPAFFEPPGPEILSETSYISPACLHLDSVNLEAFPRTSINCGDVEVLPDQCWELYKRMKNSLGENVVYYRCVACLSGPLQSTGMFYNSASY